MRLKPGPDLLYLRWTPRELREGSMSVHIKINLRKINLRESGGIGRRAGFRFQWGNPWEFESPLSYQFKS